MTKKELRRIFNNHVLPRIHRRELLEILESEGTPNPKIGEPAGTLSQRLTYWQSGGDDLEKVCFVHRYLRPDGTIGQSGLPDPKMVLHEGERCAAHIEPPDPSASNRTSE
jgi:hypothetical protein